LHPFGREAVANPENVLYLIKRDNGFLGLLRSPTRASPLATENPLATGSAFITG